MKDPRVGLALYPFVLIAGWLLVFVVLKLADWLDAREARRKAGENRAV